MIQPRLEYGMSSREHYAAITMNRRELRQCMAYSKQYSIALAALALAFLARVVGQIFVAFFGVPFLPPMEQWYSDFLPYPILLPIQIMILAFQFELLRQLWVGAGRLTGNHPALGKTLKWFSLAYFLVMVARYIVTMALQPDRRWFGGTIPIWFHLVLAAYVYLLSRYYRGLNWILIN
jgi:hypothetical protein